MTARTFAAATRLIAPRVALASCIRAHVARSTLGQPLPPPARRLNHFPATALCSITWFIDGESWLDEPAVPALRRLPRVVFGGPQTRPFASVNPGPVQAFMVMFFPHALHALWGLDIAAWVDRFDALDDVLPDATWATLSRQVFGAADDDTRARLIEDFVEPRWRAARARGDAPHAPLGDWVQALALRAAALAAGRSTRSIERRIKAAGGQPLRTLRRMLRAEQSFLDAGRRMRAHGSVSWAELAAHGGYADQAHLCREVRSVTGLSPTELTRRTRDDESFWVYRVWD